MEPSTGLQGRAGQLAICDTEYTAEHLCTGHTETHPPQFAILVCALQALKDKRTLPQKPYPTLSNRTRRQPWQLAILHGMLIHSLARLGRERCRR